MSTSSDSSDNSKKVIRDMSGYLAKNNNRTKDTQPHFRGKIHIKGKEYLISCWENETEIWNISITDPQELDLKKKQYQQQKNQPSIPENNINNTNKETSKETSETSEAVKDILLDDNLFKDIF